MKRSTSILSILLRSATLLSGASLALGQARIETWRIDPPSTLPNTLPTPESFGVDVQAARECFVGAVVAHSVGATFAQYHLCSYRRMPQGWMLEQVLQGPLNAGFYGMATNVMASGWFFVGAGLSTFTPGRIGDIFTYERTAQGWESRGTVHSTATRFLGTTGDVRENEAIVNAAHDAHLGIYRPVYIVERTGTQWHQTAVLQPTLLPGLDPERAISGQALEGDIAILNSTSVHMTQFNVVNTVHVFERQAPGIWAEMGILYNPMPWVTNDEFGAWEIQLESGWLAIPDSVSNFDPSRPGSVYMYERTGNGPGGFELRQTLQASNASPGDYFGLAVDMRPGRLLVGAPGARGGPFNQRRGQAYLFDFDPVTRMWSETSRLSCSDIESNIHPDNNFASAVAVTHDYAYVGARFAMHATGLRAGAVYVYEFPIGAPGCTGEPGPSGTPATLEGTGSSTSEVGVVDFVARGLAPLSPGLLIASRDAGDILHPGGSAGRLCLGGAIARIGASLALSNSTGVWTFALSLDPQAGPTPLPIVTGETWHFQTWFRQPGGTSNFTGSLAIGFR
jgi:hypothetical protein